MLAAYTRICTIDNLPPHESLFYLTALLEFGPKVANRWTKIIKVDLTHDRSDSRYH